MPTVADAARVTTRDNAAVWRTCTTCGHLAPLPPTVDRCAACDQPAAAGTVSARTGWDFAHDYAAMMGRIEAWAVLIPNVSDAERLTHIRQALTSLADLHQRGGRP
jgi:hypothetical protein